VKLVVISKTIYLYLPFQRKIPYFCVIKLVLDSGKDGDEECIFGVVLMF
jgi:hypothetical protein